MPKISVIMPVYNEKAEYLKNALESILNQTYQDFELIIVDDCSESYVGDIVNSYTSSKIRYTRFDENSKICAALNYGIKNSSGEYIAIMHSDDFSIRSRLEKQCEILDKYENIGLVNSYSLLRTRTLSRVNRPYIDSEFEKFYLKYIACNIVHPNVMLRKSILEEHGISYNNKFVFAEDYRMWNDIMPYCDFYTIPEVLTIYNLNVNPKRQNKEYMNKCGLIIPLENYINTLNLDKEHYNIVLDTMWEKGNIKYVDYLNMKKEIIPPLLEIAENKFSKKQYLVFKNYLADIIDEFNRFKKQNDGFRKIL